MRIIAGEFKSRIIKDAATGRTHPMGEKVRGAIFNALGSLEGKTLLDSFAGTGAIAIEALSRGAEEPVHAVEINPDAFERLKENRDAITDESRIKVHRANVTSWLKTTEKTFDIVIADPPYDAVGMKALDACAAAVNPGGLLVLSIPIAEHIDFDGFKKIDEKRYARAKIVFYRKNAIRKK